MKKCYTGRIQRTFDGEVFKFTVYVDIENPNLKADVENVILHAIGVEPTEYELLSYCDGDTNEIL